MISGSLVEIKECTLSNVQHVHPYGGTTSTGHSSAGPGRRDARP